MQLDEWAIQHGLELVSGRRTWMGVRAAKNALDAWAYQEVIYDTRPEVIVELGSLHGGGTLFLAHMLDLVGGEGTVISVDIDHDQFKAKHDRIVLVTGDTGSAEVVGRVRALCEGKRTMVLHDAAHDADVVLRDLRLYGPLVSPGCYLIVEDGIVDMVPFERWSKDRRGPLTATRQFRRENPSFRVDKKREQPPSFNPRGFLLRHQ